MLYKNKILANKRTKSKSETLNAKSSGVTLFLALIAITISNVTAQESVNASGSNATGNGGSAGYSVGQATYQAYISTNGSVAAGIQQPYEISVNTAIEQIDGISLSLLAYPNPVADYLELKVDSDKLKDLGYQLYNIEGKLLQSQKITDSQTQINMKGLVASTYFVKVIQGNKEVKIFKIIKK